VLTANRRIEIREAVRAMLEDLSDDTIENAASAPAKLPPVCCVAGHNELDAAAALLLVHLLRLEGHAGKAPVLSADQLMSDAFDPRLKEAKLICLSLIGTSTPARARYLLRRVRRRAPHANLIVAFWGIPEEDLAAKKATIDGSVQTVATFREALAISHVLLSSAANNVHLGRSGEGVAAG
jgi:hypothetical protein